MNRRSPMENDPRQTRIAAGLWKAWQSFRVGDQVPQQRNCFAAMLCLKALSDCWQNRLRQCHRDFQGDEGRIERRMRREPFQLPLGADFDALYAQRESASLGEQLNAAFETFAESNKNKLEGVFRPIDFNSEAVLGPLHERNRRLRSLLEDFAALTAGETDLWQELGTAFGAWLHAIATEEGKDGAAFHTPPEIAALLAGLLAPQSGERICDPACGDGGLLVRLAQAVGDRDFALYGQEADWNTWALCRLNLLLQNLDAARIERGAVLQYPKLIEGERLRRFEVVVSNPLFSLGEWKTEAARKDRFNRFSRGIPSRTRAEYALVLHMIETAALDRGRVGVVLSQGALFRGGVEAKIRQRLIEENLLECVIGLPANLFYGTAVPAVICIFRHGREHSDVLFIDASRDFEENRNGPRLRPEDLDRIVATWRNFESVEKYACRATFRRIEKNDFDLSLSRYIDVAMQEEEVNPQAVREEIRRLESELARVRDEIDHWLDKEGG
jgi:type I restriction enzyme M protein